MTRNFLLSIDFFRSTNIPPGLAPQAPSAHVPVPPGFSLFGQVPPPSMNSPWSKSINSPFASYSNGSFPQPQAPMPTLVGTPTQPGYPPVSWVGGMVSGQPLLYGNPPTASSPAWIGTHDPSRQNNSWAPPQGQPSQSSSAFPHSSFTSW